jgi:hypothetical protein
MDWLNTVKKNNNEFKNYINKKDSTITNKKINIIDLNIKDPNEEFELLYSNKIIDLKLEFIEKIKEECLPFFNKDLLQENNYNFLDFIKYNSKNFDTVIKNVEKFNNEYLNQNEGSDEEYIDNIYENID